MRIKYTILEGEIGDGWSDVAEASEALAKYTAAKLRAAYPRADVQVDVDHNSSATKSEVVVSTGDGQGDHSVQIRAERIVEHAWSQFCDEGGPPYKRAK